VFGEEVNCSLFERPRDRGESLSLWQSSVHWLVNDGCSWFLWPPQWNRLQGGRRSFSYECGVHWLGGTPNILLSGFYLQIVYAGARNWMICIHANHLEYSSEEQNNRRSALRAGIRHCVAGDLCDGNVLGLRGAAGHGFGRVR
jgi:hypothetical protein